VLTQVVAIGIAWRQERRISLAGPFLTLRKGFWRPGGVWVSPAAFRRVPGR